MTPRQGKIETPPFFTTAPTQQATGQMPGPQEAPALSGFSRGATGAGEPPVPGVSRWGNQPPASGGNQSVNNWFRSDVAAGPTQTVGFGPGATTQTVTTTWQLGAVWGNGSMFWEAVQVTAPNSVASTHATFSFVCQCSSPAVTSSSAAVSPGSYDCSQSQVTFNFSGTIYLSANPGGVNITYTWKRSDGATMSPITTAVPAGQTTVTVTDTWTLGVGAPPGSYWEQVNVTGPNSITSNADSSVGSRGVSLPPP